MCDPTGGVLTTALTIAGTATSAASSIYGGVAQRKAAYASAQLQQQNAWLDQRQAGIVQGQGEDEQKIQFQKLGAIKGDAIAAMSANGLDVSYGSPVDVVTGIQQLGTEDARRLREQYTDRVNGYLIDASNDTAKASAYRAQGNAAFTSGLIKAAGTIIGGATQIAKFGKKPVALSGSSGSDTLY